MIIFYHPDTLEIKGASDDTTSMEFPYVETAEQYHTLGNLAVQIANGTPTLVVVKGDL